MTESTHLDSGAAVAGLTDLEKDAGLDAHTLGQLVGLVEHDPASDPFPVNGWDAVVFVVGNATQAAHYYQSV